MEPRDQQTLVLAVYKENCDQARHHEVQRERVTTIVAQTTGFILGLFGFAKAWDTPEYVHLTIPFFIIVLGLWGFVASWKHNERAKLHVQRVRQCRKRLANLSGVDLAAINDDADKAHLAEFGPHAELQTRTHLVWKAFHLLIFALGIGILVYLWPRGTDTANANTVLHVSPIHELQRESEVFHAQRPVNKMNNPENKAKVTIALESIEENKAPTAKVIFEVAGGNCGSRVVQGKYHYTAVYEDTRSGEQYEKVWSRAFAGVANPSFTTVDYVALSRFERLADAIPEVDDSSCR